MKSRRFPGSNRFKFRGPIAAVLTALLLAFVMGDRRGQAQGANALPYSTGYLTTGNYLAFGLDLRPDINVPDANGLATGTLHVSGVPANADILAALLYWEAIYQPGLDPKAGVKFRGTTIPASVMKVSTTPPLTSSLSTCWGAAGGSGSVVSMIRADVLPFLPKLIDKDGVWSGKRLVNDEDVVANKDVNGTFYTPHTVTLPESNGDHAVQSAGATLVIVYRDPSEPLRKILVYDGVYTQPEGATMSQTIRGFYQHTGNAGRLTHIVGSGGNNQTELVTFNGGQINAGDPFLMTSPSSDRSWSNPTFDSLSMAGTSFVDAYGEGVTTTVQNQNLNPKDCKAWAAVVFSTPVLDADHDGLPDAVEDSSVAAQPGSSGAAWRNPDGGILPDLHAMGASGSHKDLFVEINAMKSDAYDDPSGHVPTHNHLPTPEVLKMVGDAYANATVANIEGGPGIRAHFDVGDINAYKLLGGGYASGDADTYLVGSTGNTGDVPRGGEQITETACVPGTVQCQFPGYRGLVAWKFGFQKYRDAVECNNGTEAGDASCDSTSQGRRRFDRVRREFFHYSLYVHARAKPKSPFPCLVSGSPTEYPAGTGTCAAGTDNPDFHVPSSVSGTADLPGGNLMISLGLWENSTGTPFVQAATTLHELGHNLNLWHGGLPATWGRKAANTANYYEPNCKPNYLSSMSYMFQVHGLFKDNDVTPYLDYSRAANGYTSGGSVIVNESGPQDGPFSSAPAYQPSWFVPLASDLAATQGLTAATRYCSGSRFNPATPPTPMARVDAGSASESIDWNGNQLSDTAAAQNINFDATYFNGVTGGAELIGNALNGFDDWSAVRLDQIGVGRATGRFSTYIGAITYDGSTFEGSTFEGSTFEGSTFEGSTFEGSTFEGSTFEGSTFEGSTFEGSTFEGSTFEGSELDYSTAKSLGRSKPRGLAACVLGGTGADACPANLSWQDNGGNAYTSQPPAGDPLYHKVYLTWLAPTFGHTAKFTAGRVQGNTVTPSSVVSSAGATCTLGAAGCPVLRTSLVDTNVVLPDSAANSGLKFTYFVTALFDDPAPGEAACPGNPGFVCSGRSNFKSIAPENDAPAANDDPNGGGSYSVNQGSTLSVTDPSAGVLANDTDDDPTTATLYAVLDTPPAHGVLTLNDNGTFTYAPVAGYAGPDSFTYKANNGCWSNGPTTCPADDTTPRTLMSPDSSTAAIVSITVVDSTAPVVTLGASTPAPNAAGWNNSAVTILVTATDPSTVTAITCTDSPLNGATVGPLTNPNTTTVTATLTVSGDGTHNIICAATDGSPNQNIGASAGSSNTRTVKIDTTAPSGPTIGSAVTDPGNVAFINGGEITAGGVKFTFSAGEAGVTFECALGTPTNPGAYSTCTSPQSYAGLTIGERTFYVKAIDAAGNRSGAATWSFKVVYTFASTPLKTPATQGSAVPITWTLKDPQGNIVSALSTLLKMESVFNGPVPATGCVASSVGTKETLYQLPSGATGNSSFRYLPPFKFNWDTTSTSTAPIITGKGCYTVLIYLDDQSTARMTTAVQLK